MKNNWSKVFKDLTEEEKKELIEMAENEIREWSEFLDKLKK